MPRGKEQPLEGGVMGGIAATTATATSFGKVSAVGVPSSLGMEAGKLGVDVTATGTAKLTEKQLLKQ